MIGIKNVHVYIENFVTVARCNTLKPATSHSIEYAVQYVSSSTSFYLRQGHGIKWFSLVLLFFGGVGGRGVSFT